VALHVERAVGDQGEDADPGAAAAAHEAATVTVFLWILLGGVVMSAIALVGSLTLVLRESTLQKVLLPLVAFAAGSMIGGALFHMLPASLVNLPPQTTFAWVAAGFALFFALEQSLRGRKGDARNGMIRLAAKTRSSGRSEQGGMLPTVVRLDVLSPE
jgi:hypothetical protein